MTVQKCTFITCTAIALVTTCTAHAAVSFTDVWYPDGIVNYVIDDDISEASAEIVDVMNYMSEYTPLTVSVAGIAVTPNLHFEGTVYAPNHGGYTYGYWDENHNDSLKKIRLDPNHLPPRETIAHEFGHALGWPHEFQRDTRDEHVGLCDNVFPWNYAKVGSLAWPDPYQNLSPYDFSSIMHDGYSNCVFHLSNQSEQNRDYASIGPNLLSRHDINAIYRMHADGLDNNKNGDRFGSAVSSGDYDDDGFKDVVVANVQQDQLWLFFYRGVATDPAENVTGLKFMPWFKAFHDTDVEDKDITFATGDFNGDGIDDLAVGQPGHDDGVGRVSLLFVNTLPTDVDKEDTLQADVAPWGRKGIEHRIDLSPEEFGLTGVDLPGASLTSFSPRFGDSLAAVRATNYRDDSEDTVYHDLVIGAPEAGQAFAADDSVKGAVVIIKGRLDPSPGGFDRSDTLTLWSPDPSAEFGSAVAAVPGLCARPTLNREYWTDFIAVGAAGVDDERGALHIYGCAGSSSSSTLESPPLVESVYGGEDGSRLGHSLAGFRVFDGASRSSFLVAGQPFYTATSGLKSGRVLLYKVNANSVEFETSTTPFLHYGGDEFGYALAVQQRPFSSDYPNEGGYETFVGIGMPGTQVDGHESGKVVIWRPFNSDGSLNHFKQAVEAANPHPDSKTRFGKSIAVLRPLKKTGGFVAGAPRAITLPDEKKAGQVTTMQNSGGDFGWELVRRDLNQEKDGDRRPSNF